MNALESLITRAERLLERLEPLLPPAVAELDWATPAFRWRRNAQGSGWLQAVHHPHPIRLDALHGVDAQKSRLLANTLQFLAGHPANNALLTGARGTGKSSLIKALLNDLGPGGLRLIEIDKAHLADLPDIVEQLHGRPERFVLFCDDLSFERGEAGYAALKSVLDGSVAAVPDNALLYATSNRRHLMPETFAENLEAKTVDGEIHPGESIEEKVSLSERFGLWLSFYPFSQDEYLAIVAAWLRSYGFADAAIAEARQDALQWALSRGSRSGRVASQFARDYAGRHAQP